MSFFGLGKKQHEPNKDGIAPDRSQRQKCWDARDAFFKCLDEHSIIDSIKDEKGAKTHCSQQSKIFDQDCAASWVCIVPFKYWS